MEKSNEKTKGALERRIQLLRDSRHTKLYYQAVIDYHEFIGSSKELTPILCELITEDKITPKYLREIFNDFLISQYLKNDVPKDFHYPNFYSAEIDEKYKLMKYFAELIKSEYDEAETPNKVYFNPNIPIIKTERDEEFFYTQKLHNQLIEKLDGIKNEPADNTEHATLAFDDTTSTLSFMNEKITISKQAQSAPHDLLKTLFKDRTRTWSTDEVLDDWHYYLEDEEVPKNKVYQAGLAVNRIVAQSTKVKDFLIVNTKNVAINKVYLE